MLLETIFLPKTKDISRLVDSDDAWKSKIRAKAAMISEVIEGGMKRGEQIGWCREEKKWLKKRKRIKKVGLTFTHTNTRNPFLLFFGFNRDDISFGWPWLMIKNWPLMKRCFYFWEWTIMRSKYNILGICF